MKDNMTVVFGGAFIALVIALFLISPVLIIWVINSLSEAGGSGFYIEHNLWNWFVAFILLVLVRGGLSSSSK